MLLKTAWEARLFIGGCEDNDDLETDEMVIELGKQRLHQTPDTCQRWKFHGQGDVLWRLVWLGILDRSLGRYSTRTASDHKMHRHRERGT